MFFIPKKNINLINKKYKLKTKKIKNRPLKNGNVGIVITSFSLVTSSQLEALRRFASRRIRKQNRKIYRIHLNYKLLKKPLKSRMGKGSGKFYRWYGYLKPGFILFEFVIMYDNLSNLFEFFNNFQSKLPFNAKLVYKNIFYNF